MLQVSQRLRDGRIEVLDVPEPVLTAEGVLVELRASLLSTGTERSKVLAGRKGLIGKARSRPDQVAQVVEKARRDGVGEALAAVRSRLDQPNPLGYSAAGVVLEVGANVRDLAPGDRVACGGVGAAHAEIDLVPGNLCVRLPDSVGFDSGAFATVGSVALHGVRQADKRNGERVALVGLGLIGQLAGRLLRASGCSVVGIDLSPDLVRRALDSGAFDAAVTRDGLERAIPSAMADCDAVLVTAASSSADPLALAALLCRDRGRVVVVGDVRVEVDRAAYYDKELDIRFSRSYGPGRYDREYEEHGIDYPIGYVRWTERRNMGAFTELIAAGRIEVESLIGERVPIAAAEGAYERLVADPASPLGILIEYPGAVRRGREIVSRQEPANPAALGVIGAGSFAGRILIPALRESGFELRAIASATGLTARALASRFDFDRALPADELIADPELGVIAIATRHASHAPLAIAALGAGKAVFLEKPPAIDRDQLRQLREAHDASGLPLVVGFNRRFAPLANELQRYVRVDGAPIDVLYRVNAGHLPEDHWLNDPFEGGGRLIGEGCHFVDFACWLVGALPHRVSALTPTAQSFTVSLEFADGSVATVLYHAGGASGLGKEYVEAHSAGRSAVLDDFRSLRLQTGRRRRVVRDRSGDKGHLQQLRVFRDILAGEDAAEAPSPLDTMAVTLAAADAARSGRTIAPDATP